MEEKILQSIDERLKNMSDEEIKEQNLKNMQEVEEDFKKFENKFEKETCVYCDKPLYYFDNENPCFHWLLRKNTKIKKEHIKLVLNKYNYFQIESYLRWVAHLDKPLININDISFEKENDTIIELTIKAFELEWTIWCKKSDFEGHVGRRIGNLPHYHFQMKINDRIFVKYKDTHIKLTERDKLDIKIMKGESEKIQFEHRYGAGMDDVFKLEGEELFQHMIFTSNDKNATFDTSYMIKSKNEKGISGDMIADMLKQREKSKKPLKYYLDENKDKLECSSIITPGKAVPEIAKRTKRKR